jgi:hypothetical protein
MNDIYVYVRLTVDEARALRLATAFGAPPKPVRSLDEALNKIRAAEKRAGVRHAEERAA